MDIFIFNMKNINVNNEKNQKFGHACEINFIELSRIIHIIKACHMNNVIYSIESNKRK